jgi:hypothetical protein
MPFTAISDTLILNGCLLQVMNSLLLTAILTAIMILSWEYAAYE